MFISGKDAAPAKTTAERGKDAKRFDALAPNAYNTEKGEVWEVESSIALE